MNDQPSKKKIWITTLTAAIIFLGIGAGVLYWTTTSGKVSIENATVSAPLIDLSPISSGALTDVYVHEGDQIPANTAVAKVGNEVIKTKVGSVVISVKNNIGKLVNHGEAVVTVIDPSQLRIVGRIQEDKGLSQINVGQSATFTVDAFGGKEYQGVVDEISPTSRAGDIVFNISDKRQEQEFDVKVRFDTSLYSELKNGMSAKLWVYVK